MVRIGWRRSKCLSDSAGGFDGLVVQFGCGLAVLEVQHRFIPHPDDAGTAGPGGIGAFAGEKAVEDGCQRRDEELFRAELTHTVLVLCSRRRTARGGL